MHGLSQLDFSNGITFIALDPRDVDTMANALINKGIDFTRTHTTVTVGLADGTEAAVKAQSLTIDPSAGSAYVLDIYKVVARNP